MGREPKTHETDFPRWEKWALTKWALKVRKLICDEFHAYLGRQHVVEAVKCITRIQREKFPLGRIA